MQTLFAILMFLTSVFLILLVLVQRGRGGGLAGAFGGMGGQSAFGTKAGDVFTRITIGVAGFWILLCIGASLTLNRAGEVFSAPSANSATSSGEDQKKQDSAVSNTTGGAGADGGAGISVPSDTGPAGTDVEPSGGPSAGGENASGDAASESTSADAPTESQQAQPPAESSESNSGASPQP